MLSTEQRTVHGSLAHAMCLWLLLALACSLGEASVRQSPPPPLSSSRPTTGATDGSPSATPTLARRTYYVAVTEPHADDSNNGLYPTFKGGQDGPWRTIRHATQTMTAGDTTRVRAGTYFEADIRFAHSGAPGAPIILTGDASGPVVIDGSKATSRASGLLIEGGRSHIVVDGLVVRNMPRSGIATDGATRLPYRDITIRNCILHSNGLSGLRLAAVDGFVVETVEAHDNAYYGVDIVSSDDGALSPANGLVSDTIVYNHVGKEGHGLAINQGHGITVSDSEASHNTIHGFDVSDMPKSGELSRDILFERNRSFDNGVAGFSINSDSHHVTYRNNIARQNGADWARRGASSGFLCYEGCWHVEFYNNTSVQNSDAGFWVKDEWGRYSAPADALLVLKNNIAYDNGRQGNRGLSLVVQGARWQVISERNNWGGAPGVQGPIVGINLVGEKGKLFTASEINRGAPGSGDVSVDPGFVDAKAGDLSLRPGSPMIDAGVDVGIPFCGAAPDTGAIESCP